MATKQNDKSNRVNTEAHTDMCEATYLIIDSISTQYIDFDGQKDNQDNIDEITKNSNDVAKALQNMDLMDSASNHTNDSKIILEGTTQDSIKDDQDAFKIKVKYRPSQEKKETAIFKLQAIPPSTSRYFKTFNKAQEILDQRNIPTNTISRLLYRNQKHSHETYVDSLCNLTDTDSLLLKGMDGVIEVKTRNGILQVPMDNFHSYKHSENGIQCLLCHGIVLEDVNMHKYEVCHMNHVVKVIDHRGMRKIDYKYSHCITCNLKVRNKKEAAAHIKTPQHIQARKLYTKPSVHKKNNNVMMSGACSKTQYSLYETP